MSDIVSVKDFAAKGDGINVTATATISSGSNALTATGAAFTAADVGKLILVPGAGTMSAVLKTTIAAFTNATHITLGANASTTLSAAATNILYGTDDHGAITAAQAAAVSAGNGLFWPSGNYLTSQVLFLGSNNTRHVNFGGVTITFTGSGSAISFDAGPTSGNLFDISFGSRECPFKIVGNPSATNAVFARAVHHSSLNIIARDFTDTALNLNFAVCSEFFVKMSTNDGGAFLVHPGAALISQPRLTGETVTDCDFYIIAEGISGTGVQLGGTVRCRFRGTSEGNVSGGGVYEGPGCIDNTFIGFGCEANAGYDWVLQSSWQTHLDMCSGSHATSSLVLQNVQRARITGGEFYAISVDAASGNCFLDYVNYVNSFTISSTTTSYRRIFDGSFAFIADKVLNPAITAPTYANSWVNFGGGIRGGGYYKTAANIVHLSGTIKNGTVGSKAFTLPAGFRPSATLFFPATNPFAGTTSFMIQVDANGDVIPQSGVNSSCALDSVAFLAEQ